MPDGWKPYLNPEMQHFHFKLPTSTHGFRCISDNAETFCANSGSGSLRAGCLSMAAGEQFRIAKRTYYTPDDLHDNRYDPEFTPILYPGQRIRARITKAESCEETPLYAALYVHDRNSGKRLSAPPELLSAERCTELSYDIPSVGHMLIDEMGICIMVGADRPCTPVVYVDEIVFDGQPKYDIDFRFERMECHAPLHRVPSQFTTLKGVWTLDRGCLMGSTADFGECYTGDLRWKDYAVEAELCNVCPGESGINVRVQGAMRSYAVTLDGHKLMIRKNDNGYRTLAECSFPISIGETRHFRIICAGSTIAVWHNGICLLRCVSSQDPYLNGCVGFSIFRGARTYFILLEINCQGF